MEKSLFQCGAIGVEGFSLLIPLKNIWPQTKKKTKYPTINVAKLL